jgi:hypothetical protein
MRDTQVFDQKKTFNSIEKAPANILARVISDDGQLIAHVMTNSFRCSSTIFKIRMKYDNAQSRQLSGSKLKIDHLITAKDSKTLATLGVKPPAATAQHNPGDIVELQGSVLGEDDGELIVAKIVPLATSERAQGLLAMPETLTGIIQINKELPDDPTRHMIAVAARGSAETITDPIAQMPLLESLVDKECGSDGFIIRGKARNSDDPAVGFTCLRTPRTLSKHSSPREILMDFLRLKGSQFMSEITPDNPWEVIPVSLFEVAPIMRDKVELIAKKSPQILSIDGQHYGMNFVHMNLMAKFFRGPVFARVTYVNLCRSKPLVLDTSIPDAATIRSIGISYMRSPQISYV